MLGEGLHERIIIIATTKAKGGEENAGFAFFLDICFELFGVGNADIKVTIGRQDDTVDALIYLVALCQGVGLLDTGSTRC